MKNFWQIRGLSPDVLTIVLQRGWQAFAGLITLACITHFLTAHEQGWYCTFLSLAAFQILVDMGLSVLLIQISAHEFSGLTWSESGKIIGNGAIRFHGLVRKAFVWYGIAAFVSLLVFPIGLFFFSSASASLDYDWRIAWGLMTIATAGNLMIYPALAIIEGTGKIREAYLVRLLQNMTGAIAIWLMLINNGGLYAAVMMPAMGILIGCIWLIRRRNWLCEALFENNGMQFSWHKEVWPLQWRMGISWLCILLMQIHTPLLFRTQGAVIAGQMGLSLTIANMLSLLAQSWLANRMPAMARAVSLREWSQLDLLFKRGCIASVSVFIVTSGVAIVLRMALGNTSYGDRLLPLGEFAALLLVTLLMQLSTLFASQLRAYRREPFAAPAVIGAILMVLGAWWAAPRYSAAGIITVLFFLNIGFNLPVAFLLWKRCNREWRLRLA